MNNTLTGTLQGVKLGKPFPWVFCNGKRYTRITRSFERAKRKAGIEDFHFHDLQQPLPPGLVMKGVDLVTVKEV